MLAAAAAADMLHHSLVYQALHFLQWVLVHSCEKARRPLQQVQLQRQLLNAAGVAAHQLLHSDCVSTYSSSNATSSSSSSSSGL
jgi:hypothetical protein